MCRYSMRKIITPFRIQKVIVGQLIIIKFQLFTMYLLINNQLT